MIPYCFDAQIQLIIDKGNFLEEYSLNHSVTSKLLQGVQK